MIFGLYEFLIRFLSVTLVVISLSVLPRVVTSQEAVNPLVHPGNRYARENTAIDMLAHWQGPVEVQFLGLREAATQQIVLSEILALGASARTDLSVHGFPNSIFESNLVSSSARIVVLLFDAEFEAGLQSGWNIRDPLGEISFAESNPLVADILRTGLVQQADSCFSRWKASNSNETEAVVIAVSNALDPSGRTDCLRWLTPSVFGVSPVVSRYDASVAAAEQNGNGLVPFEDRSELFLQLSSGAVCREELDDFSAACPYRLINQIFSHHSYLTTLRAN